MALSEDQEDMISTFVNVTESATYDTARRFLEAGAWDLEDALRDFFLAGTGNNHAAPDVADEMEDYEGSDDDQDTYMDQFEEEEEEEEEETEVDEFPSLYQLMFRGTFSMAKQEAMRKNKWLLVNFQDYSYENLPWNEAIANVVQGNYVFFRNDGDSEDGDCVRRYYGLESLPLIMVIEPITGRKIQAFFSLFKPEDLLNTLLNPTGYSDSKPVDYCMIPYKQKEQPLEELLEDLKLDEVEEVDNAEEAEEEVVDVEVVNVSEPGFPPLPEEPKEDDRKVVCKVGVRLPSGRRIQRKFLQSDPIQVLWSFCSSEMEEAVKRPFSVGFATPGRFDCLDYGSSVTLGESGVGNCMLSFRWD